MSVGEGLQSRFKIRMDVRQIQEVDRNDTDRTSRLPVDVMADALGMLRVLSKEGKDVGKVLPLKSGEVLIGRCENNAHRK